MKDQRTTTAAERERLLEILGGGSPSEMTSGTLVVVPSITFPAEELQKITGIGYYEERLMFLLFALRNPGLKMVYVTSLRIEEPIVDYYLRFIPEEVQPGHRLYLVALWQQAPEALSYKLLEQDWAMERIQQLAEDACLLTFNVTEAETKIARALDIPLYGCPEDLVWLGSKSGSRKVATEAGVPVLPGAEDLFSLEELQRAVKEMHSIAPQATACVVKLNNGFSGQGNVIVELDAADSVLRTSHARFCAEGESWDSYLPKLEREGAVVEELVRTPGTVSPSAQYRIGADGSVECISTHDQILGGQDDQVYLGCRFPAHDDYRIEIQDLGRKVGEVLAAKGVMGSFGVDFLVVPHPGEDHSIYLSEINLRMGGTTHPFLMAKHVTGGTYDVSTGHLLVDGEPRFYVSTDNLKSERYVGIAPEDLITALDRSGLAFDKRTGTGVTLHLLGALKRFGKVGAVCIGSTRDEAEHLHDLVERTLEELADDKPEASVST